MHSELEKQTIAVVDRQLEAYNARNITAFSATYHDDVEVFSETEGLLYQGKSLLVERYGNKFTRLTYLHATSLNRIVHGQFLIDYELAESSSLASKIIDRSVKVVATYEVCEGLIKRVRFIY